MFSRPWGITRIDAVRTLHPHLEQVKLVIAGLVRNFAFAPRYNVGPSQRVPVLMETMAGVKAMEMRCGIPSAWSKTFHINAQAKGIQEKSTFRPQLGQRCLVPMDGFYEWKPDKSPVRSVRRQRDVFCVAGLWREIEKPCVDLPVTEKHFALLKERLGGRSGGLNAENSFTWFFCQMLDDLALSAEPAEAEFAV